jgi:hypothetical protein
MKPSILVVSLFATIFWVGAPPAQGGTDAAPAPQFVALPGRPFGVAPSPDGQWVFVSITAAPAQATGIAVVERRGPHYELKRVVPVAAPTGIVLTHDGKVLIAVADESVLLLDTERTISDSPDPVIAKFSDGPGAASIYANVTSDDKTLFVSDQRAESISVVDLERIRSKGYDDRAMIGKIPVGRAKIRAGAFGGRARSSRQQSGSHDDFAGWTKDFRHGARKQLRASFRHGQTRHRFRARQ